MASDSRTDTEGRALRRFVSHAPEATEALGEAIGRAACAGLVLTLDGDLGAGKTCFVRGLARGLEVDDPVTSPTFALMNEYEGRLPLLHCDAWMEGRERAFLADGGVERFGGGAVAVVEWGERVADQLPRPHLWVQLAHAGGSKAEETRLCGIGIRGIGPELEALIRDLVPPDGLEEVLDAAGPPG